MQWPQSGQEMDHKQLWFIDYMVPSFLKTYAQSTQVIVHFDHILNSVANSCDDAVNDVDHSIGGHLVTVNDSGTVHCDNLNENHM